MATLQKLINQSNDAPPDISATNYLDTDATIGLVAKKNEQIDDRIKDYESTLQQKTNIFNAAHSQGMKNIQSVINFLPTAKNIYQNQQVYRDNENLVGDLLKASDEARQDDATDIVAEEIDKEYNTEIQGAVGELEANGGPKFAKNVALLSTLNSDGLNTRNTLQRIGQLTPALYAQMKLNLRLPDGRGFGDLVNPDDFMQWERHAAGLILTDIMDRHPEITRREIIKHWLPNYKTAQKNLIRQWSDTQNRIATDAYTKGQQMIRWDATKNKETVVEEFFGQNGFLKQRAAYFEAKVPGKGLHFSRIELVNDLIEGAKEGHVQNLDTLLGTDIEWNDGSKMSFEKKFPVDALKIRTARLEGETREADALEDFNKAQQDQWMFKRIDEYEGARTGEWANKLLTDFATEFKTTTFPERLKKIYTDGWEDEFEKVKRLQHIKSIGGIVTPLDIATIENPALKEAAAKLVNESMVGGVPSGINKQSEALITSYVREHTQETDLTSGRTSKFLAIEFQAHKAFRAKFAELKNQGQSDEQAQLGAQEYVKEQIKKDVYSSLPEFKFHEKAAWDLNQARTALIMDKELLISPEVLNDEKSYLDKAEAYVRSNYKRGNIPEYYRQLSKLFPDLDPHDFMMTRLVATGRIKDSKNKYDGVENSRDFTDKPTSSKVYRNALTTNNLEWITENITNPAYKSNGGFDAVTKNGKFVKLEKPLSEHTIGEVINLTDNYDSFGMYNITNYGLLQILNSPDLPFELDDLFDEDTQKALVLGRLKQKANMGHGLNGQPGFKRIVNIAKEDQEKFYKIVGELPPMNRLGNLLPGVAKALVEDSLQ